MEKSTLAFIVLAVLATSIGIFVQQSHRSATELPQFNSMVVLPAPRTLSDVDLIDHRGNPFNLNNLSGRWSLMFFGFTHCPDICPMTLYQLAQMKDSLAVLPSASQPAVYMVSVDVERDTPQVMAQYVNAFNAGFSGITGDPGELQRLASALGVAYGTEPREDGGYDVLHTAALFFLNENGDFVAIASAPHDPDALARDFQKLVGQPNS